MPFIFAKDNRVQVAYGVYGPASGRDHRGIDIDTVSSDWSVHSTTDGSVIMSAIVPEGSSDITWQWGNFVCVLDTKGYRHYYCHLNSRSVSVGQKVSIGTVLGIMGKTGNAKYDSQAEHVHYEVRKSPYNSVSHVNPTSWCSIPNRVGTTMNTGGGTVPVEKYPNVPSPVQDYGYAVDISEHQGTFNAQTAKANKIDTVLIRATYSDVKDKKVDEFYKSASNAGLNVGFYHFVTWHYQAVSKNITEARVAMKRQTEAFISHIKDKLPTSYIVLDYEIEQGHSTVLSVSDQTTVINEQLALYESYGYKCLFYTYISTSLDLFKINNPIWIANYGNNNETTFGNGRFWTNDPRLQRMKDNEYHIYMWQFSSVGNGKVLAGTQGNLDLNYRYMPMKIEQKPSDLEVGSDPSIEEKSIMAMSTIPIKMWFGPMSAGDLSKFDAILKEKAIPYTNDLGTVKTNVAVSKGDQTGLMALAVEVAVAYGPVVNEGSGSDTSALEAQLKSAQASITENNKTIATQKSTIDTQSATIASQKTEIITKTTALASKESQIIEFTNAAKVIAKYGK